MLKQTLAQLAQIKHYLENNLSTELQNLTTAVNGLLTAVSAENAELKKLADTVSALEGSTVPPGTLQSIADTINAATGNINAAIAAVETPAPAPAPVVEPAPEPVADPTPAE